VDRSAHVTQRVSSNIGSALIFQNDRVRVWEMVLEPGEASEMHRHENDYLFVYTTPDNSLRLEELDGTDTTDVFDCGYVQYSVVGTGDGALRPHRLENVGSSTHRQIIVELLGESESVGDAPAPESNGRVRGGEA
jgi:beta-alanine degradation protein BauB